MLRCKPRFLIEGIPAKGVTLDDIDFVNQVLSTILCASKNFIDEHGKNGRWDNAKTFTNPYELVYKTDAISYSPVSRAFFKMWEMIVDFSICDGGGGGGGGRDRDPDVDNDIGDDNDIDRSRGRGRGPLRVGYVAEGPGGFIQAIVEYRRSRRASNRDTHTAMTLVSKNRCVPCWKVSQEWAERNNVEFYYGKDGSGDIYNLENVKAFAEKCSGYDLITADGGFDFSGDFNSQERNVLRMLVSEVLCAILALRDGGTFVFKAFDTLCRSTACVIQVLVECFSEVVCVKPLSSRPANSEKYFVCRGYSRRAGLKHVECVQALMGRTDATIQEDVTRVIRLRQDLYYRLCLVNIAMVSRQLVTISRTLEFIHMRDAGENHKLEYRKGQEGPADDWVRNYM